MEIPPTSVHPSSWRCRCTGRFGTEFPIRFDFLDTMAQETLAAGFIRSPIRPGQFGMNYTHGQSYLPAEPCEDGTGLPRLLDGVDRAAMSGITRSTAGGDPLRWENTWGRYLGEEALPLSDSCGDHSLFG